MAPDMQPTQPVTNQASLPPLQPSAPSLQPLQPGSAASQQAAQSVGEQARQLVTQYQSNPYQLQGALQQLRNQYITSQYHIDVKPLQT